MADHWVRWHTAYDDAANPLSERRRHVVDAITRSLDAAPPGPLTVVSLCAGDATDVAMAVGRHMRRGDIFGAAVELDPELARRAAVNLERAGVGLDVRCADAGDAQSFSDLPPADLLLLVGIFGNISEADIERTVSAVPALVPTRRQDHLDPASPTARPDALHPGLVRGARLHASPVRRAGGGHLDGWHRTPRFGSGPSRDAETDSTVHLLARRLTVRRPPATRWRARSARRRGRARPTGTDTRGHARGARAAGHRT